MSKQCYHVGGSVRDILLGKLPKDFDFMWTGVTPEFLLARGMHQVGCAFPVFLDENGNEHALARTEIKKGHGYLGFECEFDPSITIEQDLQRRDLTINSLAVKVEDWDKFIETKNESLVIDPYGGINDLCNKILKHTSAAFDEDVIRVLRTARFAARYNFNIAPETLNLMCALTQSGELDHLVPERVWSEMEKAMSEPFPGDFFLPLDLVGALRVLMPELDYGMLTDMNLTRASATLSTKSRFAALFANSTVADIETMCNRLKAPSDVRKLAVRTRKLVTLCSLRSVEMNPVLVVSTLEEMGCFQDLSDTLDAIQVCLILAVSELTDFQHHVLTVSKLVRLLRDVRFASLTEEQQATLEGPAVGAALRELRLSVVKQVLS